MDKSVRRGFQCFLEEASPANFLRLRETLAASPDYAPYGAKIADVNKSLARGDLAQARAMLLALMPSYFLNPGVHTVLAYVLDELGDKTGAGVEFDLGKRCLAGILSTGDGSRERPYLILHADDEYDVLVNLAKESRSKALIVDRVRAYDRHDCEDGDAVWFDITIPYAHRNHRLLGYERGTFLPPKHSSKRGVLLLAGGLVGGSLLVTIMSFGLDDWSHLRRWLGGLAVIAIAAISVFGKNWLLGRAISCTRMPVKPVDHR